MSRQCEIVQDLLPLYVDEICSTASREMVAEHVSSCGECAAVLRSLKNNEIETELTGEKTDVIEKHNRKIRRKSALWGIVIGVAMVIPVMICLIVTLAGGSSFGSLLVVLTALMLGASLTVVPLLFQRNKFLWAAGLGTACLMLLFAAAIIPAAGIKVFFVAAAGTLFGLHVVLGPIVVNYKSVKGRLKNCKGLLVMGGATIWFVLMMLSIGLLTKSPDYRALAIPLSAVFLVLAWLLFVIIRYMRVHGLIRAGICCIVVGAFLFAFNNILGMITGTLTEWPRLELMTWNLFTIDGNVKWLCLLCGAVVGIIFIVIGIIKGGRKK